MFSDCHVFEECKQLIEKSTQILFRKFFSEMDGVL